MGRKKKSDIRVTITDNSDTPLPETKTEKTVNLSPICPEWTEYVLSLLTSKELVNNRPTCDGLRRVFEILIGEIIGINSKIIQVPSITNLNRASVETTVTYRRWNPTTIEYDLFSITDVADVFSGNTAQPFCNFPTATASTVAEGRCLRKGLRLVKVLSLEETDVASETEQSISNEMALSVQPCNEMQISVIKNLASKMDINLDKLLSAMNNDKTISVASLDAIGYVDAQAIIKRLGEYKSGPDKGGKIIPESILG